MHDAVSQKMFEHQTRILTINPLPFSLDEAYLDTSWPAAKHLPPPTPLQLEWTMAPTSLKCIPQCRPEDPTAAVIPIAYIHSSVMQRQLLGCKSPRIYSRAFWRRVTMDQR